MNQCSIVYKIKIYASTSALLDGGANGRMSGSDIKLIHQSLSSADITAMGLLIGFFRQYAHYYGNT